MTRRELIYRLDHTPGMRRTDWPGFPAYRWGEIYISLFDLRHSKDKSHEVVIMGLGEDAIICRYADIGKVYVDAKGNLHIGKVVCLHDPAPAQKPGEISGGNAQNMSEEQKRPSDASKTVGQESTQAEPKTKPEGRISSSVRAFMNGRLRMRARTCDGASGTRVFHAYGNILQLRY